MDGTSDSFFRASDRIERAYALNSRSVRRLPVAEFVRKLGYLKEHEEGKQKQELELWLIGQWANIRAIHHALIADKELPPGSKQEAEAKTNWSKMAEAKRWREEHDHEFRQALMSPRHFGRFIGMESVLGPPPAESVKTAEEMKQEEAERNKRLPDESRAFFLKDSVLARAAASGKTFSPAN